MIFGLSLTRLAIYAVIAAAVVGAVTSTYLGWREGQREVGRAEIRAEWTAASLAESQANARETLRRVEAQQENQREQDKLLAAARLDAGRNLADAERLRSDNASIAGKWRAALAHSTPGSDCQAAGDAIGVLADVLGRADRRASFLASYADAARAAGLKCEADYDALTGAKP